MREYELAFIIRPTVDEEGVTGVVDQVSQYVRLLMSGDVGFWPTQSRSIARVFTFCAK